jgi:hypothetical protein
MCGQSNFLDAERSLPSQWTYARFVAKTTRKSRGGEKGGEADEAVDKKGEQITSQISTRGRIIKKISRFDIF